MAVIIIDRFFKLNLGFGYRNRKFRNKHIYLRRKIYFKIMKEPYLE